MTERVVQQDHSERAVYGGSGLWECCMKTIPELYVEEMTEMLDTANATSKSDFVCQAVQFYIGYLHQKKCIDYLSPILAQTIKSEIESVEKNISEMLFKVAVEQAKLSNVISATNQIDKVSLSALNNLCAEEVARNNGIITFEDAYKFQRG